MIKLKSKSVRKVVVKVTKRIKMKLRSPRYDKVYWEGLKWLNSL